jgi:hypothetical protein
MQNCFCAIYVYFERNQIISQARTVSGTISIWTVVVQCNDVCEITREREREQGTALPAGHCPIVYRYSPLAS